MRLYAWKEYNPRESIDLGCAVGTYFGKDRVVGIGRDGKPVSRFIRRELISGLASTGITTLDVRLVPSVSLRHVIAEQNLDAGLYVSYYNGEVQVHLYDKHGDNANPSVIEKILAIFRARKFITMGIEELGTTTYYPNAMDDYLRYLHASISFKKDLQMLVDCQGDPIAIIIEPLLSQYGIQPTLMNAFLSGYSHTASEDAFLNVMYTEGYKYGLRIERDDTLGMYVYTPAKKLHANNWLETLALLRDL
jgi:phosphomannomutase